MTPLGREDLHPSLGAPALESIGFLNEIMDRHPDAISFAPGAPHPDFLSGLDVTPHIDRCLDHLVRVRGDDPEAARRRLWEYGPSKGLINDIVAEALRRDCGIDAAPDALVITVGAQEGLFLTLRALFRSDRDVLAVADPSFVGVIGAARLLGIGIVGVPETPYGMDLARLERECRAARSAGRRVRACYVAPDFANPGGSRMDRPAREALIALARREDLLLIEDNVYGFTAAPDDRLPALKCLDGADRVVHVGTFAKVCMPGARVGFVLADQPVRDAGGTVRPLAAELAALKGMVTVNTPPLCQAVIGGMILAHGGSIAALGAEKSTLYRRNLATLCEALDRHLGERPVTGVTWHRPSGGFFVRMRLPAVADAALLDVAASRYGVLFTPMAPFYLDGAGSHLIRLSCSYLSGDQIEDGVVRLVRFLRNEM